MKSIFSLLLLACTITFSTPTFARTPVPIVNYANLPITSASGASLQASDVEQAILAAANLNHWTITSKEAGNIEASLSIGNNKHIINVSIPYTASTYSILYKSSHNMKFEQRGDVAYIHPFYNRWVDTLKESINRELLRR